MLRDIFGVFFWYVADRDAVGEDCDGGFSFIGVFAQGVIDEAFERCFLAFDLSEQLLTVGSVIIGKCYAYDFIFIYGWFVVIILIFQIVIYVVIFITHDLPPMPVL